jgi:hypothetical protein
MILLGETIMATPETEKQTCPRRVQEPGPWDRAPGQDLWRRDRWSIDRAAVDAAHDAEDAAGLKRHNENNARVGQPPVSLEEYRTKWFVRGENADLWHWSGEVPRTCSFCGGVHPEDAIRLVSDGWEVESTSKSYKRYLTPPGSALRHHAFLASLRDRSREPGEGVPSVWSPTPPVKLYAMHFDADQIGRLDDAMRKSR